MKLTTEQDQALKSTLAWVKRPFDSRHWCYSIAGYAGTGKTTLLKHIVGSDPQKFKCCAPTGKAASVLQSKLEGLARVTTVHQLLYQPHGRQVEEFQRLRMELQVALDDGKDEATVKELEEKIAEELARLASQELRFSLKADSSLTQDKVIIVDEASMVSMNMIRDFTSLGCKVLFVGDHGQLPPVRDSGSWFLERRHDVSLTSIMRQALDSPIIRLSMEIRAGKTRCSEYGGESCQVLNKTEVPPEEWLKADQIITGSNASRRRINRFCRKKLGRLSDLPMAGDKLICLKNSYDHLPQWINGIQFLATEDVNDPGDGHHLLNAIYEGCELQVPFYSYHCQVTYDESLQEELREMRAGLFECDFAYAITAHKSQGSEWPYVIVADDKMQYADKEFRMRWLYTAVTRAKDKLLIVQ